MKQLLDAVCALKSSLVVSSSIFIHDVSQDHEANEVTNPRAAHFSKNSWLHFRCMKIMSFIGS